MATDGRFFGPCHQTLRDYRIESILYIVFRYDAALHADRAKDSSLSGPVAVGAALAQPGFGRLLPVVELPMG